MSTQKVIIGLVAGTIALGVGIAVQAPTGGLRRVVTGGGDVLGGSGTSTNPLTFTVHVGDGWSGTGSNGSALVLVPTWDAGWFGYGTDGACNFDGVTVVAGITPASNVYTLTRDIYCTVSDVSALVTVNTGGYRFLSKTSLNNNGTISRVGLTAGSNIGASALASGTMWGSAAGGTSGASGANAGNLLPRRWKDHGGTGGKGGDSTFATGTNGGVLGTTMTATNGDFNLTYYAMTAQTTNGSTSSAFSISAGGGAGAGVGNGSCIGTGGGSGGGAAAVFIRHNP